MSNGGSLAASTRHKPDFLNSFVLLAVRHHRQAGRRSATEERADGARAFEAPHIAIADELGAFLCADLGITSEPRADHAQHLASWLTVLKADKRSIFTAASKATEAAAFLAALQSA